MFQVIVVGYLHWKEIDSARYVVLAACVSKTSIEVQRNEWYWSLRGERGSRVSLTEAAETIEV